MKLKIWSLKIMLGLAGLVIGVFALMLFWRLPRGLTVAYHQAGTAWLMTIGIYVAVVCFFGAIVFAWHLLKRVETDTAFSWLAVRCRAARYSGIHSSHYFGLKQLCFAGLM